ncbi:hypothetical protein NP511_13265 [Natrinema thermotolerans]|uniref:Uncharacterized protein n=1 Tax=Natrinema thermotolerans TaxID=121872 RepID=A0AAF0P8B6_9EURY|nr:hypothetical protein [Natrinema thermotolerans]QCC59384.1 hypothetical protein DVR14_12400 [Natrinema thermotolerans]WMT06355.1 hypothetical protein NP511_13265 [Natrinema thermotolerans]
MTTTDADPPETVPEEIAAVLEDSSDSQLREIINYAQRCLREQPPLTDTIEARNGEELVRIAEYDAYTNVVVERPDETGEARGPFAYRVRWEPHINDEGGTYRWHYLGRVYGGVEGDRDD